MARLINTKDQVNRILTNQTNLNTSLATGGVQHDLSLGLELTREEQTNYGLATSGSVPSRVSVYNPDASVTLPAYVRNGADSKGKTDTVALYAFDAEVQRPVAGQSGSAPGPLQDLVQRHGGLRGHLDHPALRQQPVGTVVPTTSDGLSKSGTLLSWKAGLLYKPAPNGSVYLNYALSQQPPGGSNFALSAAVNNAANPNMDPQKAKTLELGSKWELAEKNLMLSGALFRTEVTNEIVTNSDGTVGQTGKKIVQGLELGVIGQINKAWGVSAGYTVQNTKVDTGALVAADASNGLTYTPKNAFSLWSTYQLPFGLTDRRRRALCGRPQARHRRCRGHAQPRTPTGCSMPWPATA
jgi:catecholate siderophore receptor